MPLQMHLGGQMVEVPLPRPIRNVLVYHYTNAAGFLGIAQSDELWASSALALNDLSEITYGLEVFLEATDGRADSPSELLAELVSAEEFGTMRAAAFFLSASTDGDSLSQWIGYGGVQGYALGLDTNVPLALRVDPGTEVDPATNMVGQPLAPGLVTEGCTEVIYDRGEQVATVVRLLDFCHANGLLEPTPIGFAHALSFFGALLPQFKHSGFKDEREVRLITVQLQNTKESYRTGRNGIIPYVRLIPSDTNYSITAEPVGAKLPIRTVTTGPVNEAERQLVTATTHGMLKAHGYETVAVQPSAIPYRF